MVDTVMAEMRELSVTDETWTAKFSVMKENLEHHIEEEENQMFKQARQVFDESDLEDLGETDGISQASVAAVGASQGCRACHAAGGRVSESSTAPTTTKQGGLRMSDSAMFGIGQLRDRRGGETVTFDEVADLLVAFVDHNPNDTHAIDSLASFLAKGPGIDDDS